MSSPGESLPEKARQATRRSRVWAWMSRQLGHDDSFSEDRFREALRRAGGAATVRKLLGTVSAAAYQDAARIVAEETPHLDGDLVEMLWKADAKLVPLLADHEALGGESWQRLDELLADFFSEVFPNPNLKDADRLVPALEAIRVLLERGLLDRGDRSLEALPGPASANDPSPAEIVTAARATVPALRDEDDADG